MICHEIDKGVDFVGASPLAAWRRRPSTFFHDVGAQVASAEARLACAADKLAIGIRKGEHET
jgi:hypothetical protein